MISYDEAHAAANRALVLEPRAPKARYRRAIARKHLKLFPEALVDVSSVLTTDPDNRDAKVVFSLLVEMHKEDGRRPLVPDAIIAADLPHAYGSSANPPRANIRDLHQLNRPFFRNAMMSPTHTNPVTGLCHNCKVTMDRRDLKTCQKCRRVNYCSVQCQKIEWPEHKLLCAKAIDEK
ncbi:hypothetical protein C8J57DRAFT_668420 [Mycena rebaudengoi]|nr:hypothetical protein C8J57DRAFT_668420 [Mycena rebaudengoi]